MAEEISPSSKYVIPQKAISCSNDMRSFLHSPTFRAYVAFIGQLSTSVQSRGNEFPALEHCSEPVKKLVEILDKLIALVDEVPLLDQPMRFGNKAYRTWHKKMEEMLPDLLKELLPESMHDAIIELAPMFDEAFGHKVRIDFGTGHEATFMWALCCMYKIGFFSKQDFPALVTKVFTKYLDLIRHLISFYSLEPAGSHGVWSLDDYNFLAFVFGSSQLMDNPEELTPDSIHSDISLKDYGSKYLYLDAINHIKTVKVGCHFGEHSPILNDISGLPSWSKVHAGMFKMFQAEVIGKFPVVQHFLFGSILPADWTPAKPTRTPLPSNLMGFHETTSRGLGASAAISAASISSNASTRAPWASSMERPIVTSSNNAATRAPWASLAPARFQ
eukprot:TRINITY_DN53598_c0_g1_i1.p1 TRINITY_DN53598_c0_g1~~TRINITY_DN53598_c0_g1_i1.p1  ORF type:complete len:388 (+),score=101.34 TRINITY_DN53598_c0_g1_i1:41-1204(+)